MKIRKSLLFKEDLRCVLLLPELVGEEVEEGIEFGRLT